MTNQAIRYKYYLLDNGAGEPYEIYRGSADYAVFSDSGLERAKKDGTWSVESSDIKLVVNLWLKGDFDPDGDEVSEQHAEATLASWRSGTWPGRS